jgi:hypothetical protein
MEAWKDWAILEELAQHRSSLNITATNGGKFTIYLTSIDAGNSPGTNPILCSV